VILDQHLTLTLPWPPSVNNYYLRLRARVVLKPAARTYRDDALAAILSQLGLCTPLRDPVAVLLNVFPPDAGIRDLDNICKATLDSLKRGRVIIDDSIVDDLHVMRQPVSRQRPRVEVAIRRIPTALEAQHEKAPDRFP
jgi:crossover junction endodeoxyribonuclease RusA